MSVFQIFEQLEAASGQNDKVKILKENADNEELYLLLDLALNFKQKFYIKKWDMPPATVHAGAHRMMLGSFQQLCRLLTERKLTGQAGIDAVRRFFSGCTSIEQKWYSRVLLKDLRCNFGISLCEKAGIDIPEFEVMLAKDGKECKKLKEIVNAGVYVSPKFNGYRCLAVSTEGEVTLYSRKGVEYENFPQIVEALEKIGGNFVLDGEIMSDDFNAMQQTALSSKSNKTVGDVYYAVFGWIPVHEWEAQEFKAPTKQRLENLGMWFDAMNPDANLIRKVEHQLLYKVEDCLEYEKQALAKGYEGAMLLPNIPYYLGKKTNKLLKLKTFHSMDCPVLAVYEGEGKYVGTLGGLTVMQENGVKCDVGSGFSDEDRDVIWKNPENFIGRLIEVQYQEIQEKHQRMQFPTFQRWRDDK
jgi:DNA ligase 1